MICRHVVMDGKMLCDSMRFAYDFIAKNICLVLVKDRFQIADP